MYHSFVFFLRRVYTFFFKKSTFFHNFFKLFSQLLKNRKKSPSFQGRKT
ncbi:hypothetical protein HMPREF1987_01935 [Peptostreptococcaceae bacterium oral taxon 113 str. W5053]|nr:hypothetical protein HMPREF1987_01935 [Peptostreptococcaceae bacterium oral taxon 113 str. W5053]